jgi:hypothetical protein
MTRRDTVAGVWNDARNRVPDDDREVPVMNRTSGELSVGSLRDTTPDGRKLKRSAWAIQKPIWITHWMDVVV